MNVEFMVTYGYLIKKTISKIKSRRGKVVILDKVFIRYVKMIFFIFLMLYTIFSKKFKSEVAEQIKYM